MSTLLLIDGNNLAHRARHGFSLASPDGLDVSVTFGVLNSLRSYLKMFDPDSCLIAWDGSTPMYRRDLVPEYKSNRASRTVRTIDSLDSYLDFLRQLDELDEVLESTGTVNVMREGIEADDTLYRAAFLCHEKYDKIIIVTNDADLYQAVEIENTFVFNPGKNVLVDTEYVEGIIGVPIDQFVQWKAIQGDKSDNIPGVPGVGPVRATKLLKEYGSLTGIYHAVGGKITGKMGDNLREFGLQNISKNWSVMSLKVDQVGARSAIITEVADFELVNVKKFKNFLLSKSFISIMDGDFFKALRKLEAPILGLAI